MLFQNVSILWCKNVTWSIYLKYWDTAWYLQKCNNFDKKEAASWCLIMWDFITVVVAFLWYTSIILQYSCLWEMFFTFNFPGTLAWKLALPRPCFLYKNLSPLPLLSYIIPKKPDCVCNMFLLRILTVRVHSRVLSGRVLSGVLSDGIFIRSSVIKSPLRPSVISLF